MFGRPDMAAQAKLNMAVAGAPELVAAVEPVLRLLGRPWPLGEDARIAHLAKIAGNFMIGCAIETLAESAALIDSHGGDPAPFVSMLTETLFAAPVYKSYGPAMARGQSPGAPLGLALPLKDIGLALNEAHATELPLPLAKLLDNRLGAARDKGFTDDDWSIALAREARQP